jgi:hypothetical protein
VSDEREAEDEVGYDEEEIELDEDEVRARWRELIEDPEIAARLFKSIDGFVPDVLKRRTLTSLLAGGEEKLRERLLEKNIPKEVVGVVLSQADSMRKETLRVVSREIRIFLENMDFGGEIAKILTSVSFEVKTEVRFIPNDQAVKPQIKNKVKMKVADDTLEDVDGALEEESAAEEERDGPREPRARKLRWGLLKRNKDRDEPEAEEGEGEER